MTILNTIQDGLQSGYNVIGATGLRAIVAATKMAAGYLIHDNTMMGAGFLQGVAACSTSLVSTSPNITAAAIIAESALINGLSYVNTTSRTFMNGIYAKPVSLFKSAPAVDIKGGKKEVQLEEVAKPITHEYLKLVALTAVDAAVEGLIVFMDQDDACEVNVGFEMHGSEF